MLARSSRRTGSAPSPGSEKLAVSFDKRLAASVRKAAHTSAAGNVSAWLAEAAREQLRLEAGRSFLKDYEAEHGVVTKDELAQVRRRWPRD
jgi:hypothetical protein